MLIVMTNGDTDNTWAGGSSPEALELLGKELLGDVIPLIEKNYRVNANRANRAITGLSMGGGQAFTIGLKHLETFAWVGEFSSGLLSDTDFNLAKHLPGFLDDPARANQQLKLLFLSCGTEDPRIPGHLDLMDALKAEADPLCLVSHPRRARVEGLAPQPRGVPAKAVPVTTSIRAATVRERFADTLHRFFLCTILRGLCHTGRNVGSKFTHGHSRKDLA